jgi:glycosyltransferase involved in cell wall biosynthesis
MNEIRLSYLITTKNKLPYLKQSIQKLIEYKKNDEEILVADGASTDGTGEFLQSLKDKGFITYFISEQDYGEAHGLNKLFLQAKGTLITIVTDDDVFHYETISCIKDFMLAHLEIDMTGTEGGFKDQNSLKSVRAMCYEQNYKKWQINHTPFACCCLGIIFRRSSLPLLGLWNTSYKKLDAEFSLRNTAGKANIAWYTGHAYVNISNPQSTSIVYMKRIKSETDCLNKLYFGKNENSFLVEKFKIFKTKLRNMFFNYSDSDNSKMDWSELVKIAEDWLEKTNKEKRTEFLWNK